MKIDELSQFLTQVSLFKGLNALEISEYLSKTGFKIKNYKKNETVFFRGDFLKNVIIVIKGTAHGEMQKFNGDITVINRMKSGEVVASAFLFGKSNVFPVDLIALENSKFLFLNKEKYLNLIQSDKRLLLNFINKTIEEKILSYIKENTTNGIIKFFPNISALAKQFEVTRPALSREISNLCKEKILTKIENNLYSVDFQQISQRNVWYL